MPLVFMDKRFGKEFNGIFKDKDAEEKTNKSRTDAIKEGMWEKIKPTLGGQAGAAALDFANQGLNGVGASISTGIARNPHIAVYYVQPDLRSHNFAYRLSARNSAESETVKGIIRFFKSAQAPTIVPTTNNHLFGYPDEFQITFNNETNLFKIYTCVLKDFTVNYHAQGNPAYFRDTKAPVDVDISLTFQEVGVITRDMVNQGY